MDARSFLAYVMLPAWVVPGLLDWFWHRSTKIEENAGARESMLHLLMGAEAGGGVLFGLLFDIDAGVIAAMTGAALLHEVTVCWDVNYATYRRPLHQWEQHTHSFLEVLPFVAPALVAFAYPEQAKALLGVGKEKPRFDFRVKLPPEIPPLRLAAIVAVCGVLAMGPHVEEFVRCLRTKPTLAPQPILPRDERAG
jgi:hypothetical protein